MIMKHGVCLKVKTAFHAEIVVFCNIVGCVWERGYSRGVTVEV